MSDKRALAARIADLRLAASQARALALSRDEPELKKSFMELARKLDSEADELDL